MTQESHRTKLDAGVPNTAVENATYVEGQPAAALDGASEILTETVRAEGGIDRAERAEAAAHASAPETFATEVSGERSPLPAALKPDDDQAGTILGDYKLLHKLGQGGMGEVYEAYQISLGRVVALKLLPHRLSNNPRFVQRLQREARNMAKVDHPNILQCYDVGEVNGHFFLTMECIYGGNIEDWLAKVGRFSLGDALHIILKVAVALEHAHERNIIHRDVKPANILLTGDGVIKLADLGLAKDTEEDFSLTKTGTSAGTPIYMAPEQAHDAKRVDARVDIYALGVMLYVFLTGLPPFKGRTFVELIAAKDKGTFEPIRKHLREIPPKLDLIVDRMLATDPNRRFTCSDVIPLLQALGLANETLSFLDGTAAAPLPPIVKSDAAPTMTHPAGKACDTQPADVESSPTDVWYLRIAKGHGKIIVMPATVQQIHLLINTRNLDGDAPISKSETTGFREAATFPEFAAYFKRREAKTEVETPAAEPDYPDSEPIEEASGTGSVLFQMLAGLLLLAGLAGGAYFFFVRVLANP